jgi:DnaJ-class molecular chaperone
MAISLDVLTPSPYNVFGGPKEKREMEELVTCPVCEGKGWVSRSNPKKPEASGIEGNVAKFLNFLGREEEQKLPYRTCPNCNGLGMVRK